MNDSDSALFRPIGSDPFTPVRWEGSAMEWRKIIGSPFCDLPPSQKHVLATMARFGSKWGDDIFPSQRLIAVRAYVTTKCVTRTMKRAELDGWIRRYELSGNRGYKRHTYELCVPSGVLDATTFMKKKFWDPPYNYRLARCDGELFLEDIHIT